MSLASLGLDLPPRCGCTASSTCCQLLVEVDLQLV